MSNTLCANDIISWWPNSWEQIFKQHNSQMVLYMYMLVQQLFLKHYFIEMKYIFAQPGQWSRSKMLNAERSSPKRRLMWLESLSLDVSTSQDHTRTKHKLKAFIVLTTMNFFTVLNKSHS